MDLKDIFLHTTMEKPEYMKLPYKYFLVDIQKRYNLENLVSNDYVYIKIQKEMYGLKQAAVLAYTQVSTLLKKAGYQAIVGSLGMWKHITRKFFFCLCVDDFGIKYYDKDDILHLENALKLQYTANIDWEGNNFLDFKLEWNYSAGHVTLSMPDYISNALKNSSACKMFFYNTLIMSTIQSTGQREVKLSMQGKKTHPLFFHPRKQFMSNL